MAKKQCQIQCLDQLAEPTRTFEILWQRRKRAKRIIKRRWEYLSNSIFGIIHEKDGGKGLEGGLSGNTLVPGDLVRVRSKEEIQSTLDRWNQLKGCGFMEEMMPYCGTRQRVYKRVKRFLDERDYLLKKCTGIVILEGVFCEGTKDFGSCDRSCFFFWREEWLERIDHA